MKFYYQLFSPSGRKVLFVLLLLIGQFSVKAQYFNVNTSGYTADVVGDGATGAGINSTTADVDGADWIFVSTTFNPGSGICATGTNGLPATNLISSSTTPGLVYTLQPYNANNSLRLPSGSTGTLTLSTPSSASNIYLLALGGSGACTVTSTITFTDLSTQSFVSSIADWCSGAGAATAVFYRINRNSVTCSGGNCQYLYEANLAINPANYGKTIASITISSTGGILNVMGVGAKTPCQVPSAQPTVLTLGSTTTSSIGLSFTPATPAPIGYLVVRYPQGSIPTPPVNGTFYSANQSLGLGTVVDTSTIFTSFTATGLTGSTSYDFYVYSYNSGTTCGGPMYRTVSPLTSTFSTAACSGTLTGTIQIGPGLLNTPVSGYTSLTNALAEINTNGLAGNTILELQAGYDGSSANETFPIVIPNHPCLSSARTLTIRPASGVTSALTITSANAGATINFNGGDYVTIDGRAGGIGTTKYLTISNTNTAGAAVQFINDARNNTIRYCDLQGQNTSSTTSALSGVVYFSTAHSSLLTGNDNNTISFCDVHGTAGGTPAVGICSYGSITNAASWNDNNTITDCNVYDFFSATTATTGIKLENGSHAFTISNNRFYQTATRNYTAAVAHRILWLTPNTSNANSPCAFQVLNNYIGGNNALGTGTYTITGTAGVFFWGMDINHWGVLPTSVQGNTITNISVSSTITGTGTDFFRGISTGSTGNVNIGTVTGNVIGSATVDRAIVLSTTGTGTNAYGIKNGSTTNAADTINIYNNIIGGITDSTTTATNGALLYGIAVTTGSFTNIVNNTIGSTTVPNSIILPNPATAIQTVMGISVPTGLTNHIATITGNTIANITNGYVGTSTGYTRGIAVLSSARTVITGNTMYNLKTASTYTGSATTACLLGIISSTANLTTVTGNTIHSLTLTNPTSTAASFIEGIYISANGSTPTHLINKNFIHSFDVASTTNTNAALVGIDIAGGANILANNMIRLGIKPDGTDLTNALLIRGIFLNTTTATNVYHNTVYIGGNNIGSTVKNTMAFQRNSTGTHDIRNNIFTNNRSNATLGSGGKHYQLYLNTTTSAVLNNNVYYGIGNDTRFATPNNGTNDSATYSINWASSGDQGSVIGDPQFVAANADASTVSLHLHPTLPTAAESAGTLISSVTDDIDGDIRSINTPNDAGADAGNFTGINMIVDSTVASQITTSVVLGASYQQILGIRIYTRNAGSPIQVSSFLLNTALTTNNLDIQNARVYYTGASGSFDTASVGLFGTLSTIPNGAFTVTGTRNLIPGVNTFWLAYDIKGTATAGNLVDAKVDDITLSGSASPNILYGGNPAGTRTIKGPMNGNYNVGAGQVYTTLTSAVSDLNILGVSGPVTLTLKDILYNTSSGEIFPITLSTFQGVSAINTVTILPDLGIASRIEANNGTAVIDLNGAKYITIDGRQGGVGAFVSGNNLQLANIGTNGPAIRFINEASGNKIRYVDLRANNTIATATAGAGVVNFGTTTGINGNDSNLIEFCDIHEDGSGFPLIGISSIGSATTVISNNDGNTIDNCNIYNYFSAGTASAGMYIGANNGGWTVTNNHFYQTASRTYTSAVSHRAVWITPNTASLTSASGFTISNNYIGGNAANGTGTYTMTGTVNYLFYGMDISLGLGTVSNIHGNTITNLNMTASNTGSALYGFNLATGNILFGTSAGNIVGSTTTNGAVSYTSASNGGAVLPFRVGGGPSVTLRYNIASGISLTGSTTTTAVSFFGMNLSGGTVVLADSNFIGYPTLANSITLGANTSATASVALGIITNTGTATSHSIIGNQICNITNNYTGNSTASSVRALHVSPTGTGAFVVSGNKIEQIVNGATSTGTAAASANHAITVNTTTATSVTITRNIIRSVNSTGASGAVVTNGIYYAGPTSGNHIISRNLIHSISPTTANPAATVIGIDANSGAVTVANNMIRLGIDSTGNSENTAFSIRGISKSTAASRIYFNTVYIGGSGVGTDANRTFCLFRAGAGIDTVRNNIFINQRLNGSPIGGGHFGVSLNNANTLAMDYNLVKADSIGVFNSLPQLTLSNWKGASGIDANTVSSAVTLVNASGTTGSVDLHISSSTPTPIEGSGITDAGLGLSDDFDGENRLALTPTDIGADAGNFVASDVAPPSILFTPLANTTATTDRLLTATISDVTGVYLSGTLIPRIYFKKQSSGTFVSSAGVFVSGTPTNSIWNFTISASALSGLSSNDSVYYYVVAQDSTPFNNIGSFPGGVEATTVNSITTHPGTPSRYWITPIISGVYTVGNTVPCNYSSLTQAINLIGASVISGPVTLELMDPLYDKTTETFPIVIPSLGLTASQTLTIRPAAGVTAVIRDSITHAVLDLNGVDYLTLDGRQGGSGTPNSLIIENRSVSNVGYGTATNPNPIASAIRFINDATNNTLKYLTIRGANGTNESGVIFFSTGTVVGNSYNTIDHCDIGNVPGISNPFTIFCGLGSTDIIGKFNRNNIISNNNIFNFFAPAGESNGFKISKGNTAWTISGNQIYQTAALTGTGGTQYIMNLNRRVGPTVSDDAMAAVSLDSMIIVDNVIGGSGPNASGTTWSITGAGPNFSGIYGEYGKNSTIRVSRNVFTNFEMNQNTTGNRWVAINLFNGLANIDSNVIGSTNTTNAIVMTSNVNGTGIIGVATNLASSSTQSGTIRISYNKIGSITINGNATTSVNFTGVSIANAGGTNANTYRIENNTIGNELPSNIITTGASTSTTSQNMTGIANTANSSNMIIRNNIIQNMTNTYSGTATSVVQGINLSVAVDTITGNYISNLINAAAQVSGATTNTVSVTGIQTTSSLAGHYISDNTLRNLWNTNTGAVNTGVIGIVANNVGNSVIANNTMYGLGVSASAPGAFICGVSINSANNLRVYNNMISLGLDTLGAALPNTPGIAGINKLNTGSVSALHNTVYIQGSGVGTGSGITAAYSRGGLGVDTLINNILINQRSNASTGGAHYAINLNTITTLTSHHNLLDVGDSNAGDTLIGLNGSIGYLSLPAWSTFSSLEVGSKDSAMAFVSNTNLHLAPSVYGAYTLMGTVISGVTKDIDGQNRSIATPYMGADEIPGAPLPVKLVSFNASVMGSDVRVYWTTASEVNNSGFEVQSSVDGKTFRTIGFVKGQNVAALTSYNFVDVDAFSKAHSSVLYYRLKQLDRDGSSSLSQIVVVSESDTKTDKLIQVYPNPTSDVCHVSLETTGNEVVHIETRDIHGRLLTTQSAQTVKGLNVINLEQLPSLQAGIYFISITTSSDTTIIRLLKK